MLNITNHIVLYQFGPTAAYGQHKPSKDLLSASGLASSDPEIEASVRRWEIMKSKDLGHWQRRLWVATGDA